MKVRPTSKWAKDADIHGGAMPYTEAGLARLPCGRPGCDGQASEQWQFRSCAIGGTRVWVPVCAACDAELNELVLRFWKWPGVNIAKVMADYRERLGLPRRKV